MPKYNMLYQQEISIHALRVEGDRRCSLSKLILRYFYPRPPGGGRLKALA